MSEDRLRKDYDQVENLNDLITAREERSSSLADDLDALDDISGEGLEVDANTELTWPHIRTRSDEDGKLGINVDLMETPDEKEIAFDWQDSVEEMLPTDPEPDEGMGLDRAIYSVGHQGSSEIVGSATSSEDNPDLDTDATESERKEYRLESGEPPCSPGPPVPLETGMDTDSDEYDFSIEEKFAGQVPHETAEYEFEEMRVLQEGEEAEKK